MDIINLEILEDGTITVKTKAISAGNHMSAENLLEQMEELLGGQITKQQDPHKHAHVHTHTNNGVSFVHKH